eukprot:11316869-Karenia_brevis.AAC.1
MMTTLQGWSGSFKVERPNIKHFTEGKVEVEVVEKVVRVGKGSSARKSFNREFPTGGGRGRPPR